MGPIDLGKERSLLRDLKRQDGQQNLWVWGLSGLGLRGNHKDPDCQKQNKKEDVKSGEFLEQTHEQE